MARVVLVGYGQMLNSLIEGILNTKDNEIVGVLRTDRIKYDPLSLFFKDIFAPSSNYIVIKRRKLNEIKVKSVNVPEFKKELNKLKADLVIVGSWAEKFGADILNFIPVVNFHPSLLPKNRGANPYFWTILKDQKITGLSIHFMNEEFNKGDVILQEAITIDDNETGQSLKDKTTKLARILVQDFLNLYNTKQIQTTKQNEKFASYEKQITSKDTIIDLNKDKVQVSRHIRALYPWKKPKIKIKDKYKNFYRYNFLDMNKCIRNLNLDDKVMQLKNGTIIDLTKTYATVKGSDFVIRVYFI